MIINLLPSLNEPATQMKTITIEQIKEIVKLSKKTIPQLRKLNPERAYDRKDVTKYQLIYQIVFLMDAPEK